MRCVAIGSSADAGSSMSRISGWTASARAMQSRCCWPPESASADSCSRSFTSSQIAAALRLSSTRAWSADRSRARPLMRSPYATLSKIDFGKRVRLLEHHADPAPEPDDVAARGVDVVAVDEDLALDAGARDDVVHPVQRPQERALAAARRPDEGRHEVRADANRDRLERPLRAVEEVQVASLDDGRPRCHGRLGSALGRNGPRRKRLYGHHTCCSDYRGAVS